MSPTRLKSSNVEYGYGKKRKRVKMYKERPWQVGEVELEMHVDRVLGLDRGVFACDYHGSSAGKLWHEIGIYHQFIMCLGITHNRCTQKKAKRVYPKLESPGARLCLDLPLHACVLCVESAHAGTVP